MTSVLPNQPPVITDTRIVTDLILRPLPNREWRVEQNFIVETKTAGRIIVPKGFVCDLNSLPRLLWWSAPPSDYPEAGVVHDWAYRTKRLPRDLADQVYAELLTHLKAGDVRTAGRYIALRLFGWKAYGG